MDRRAIFLIGVALVATATPAFATDGDPDPAFGANGLALAHVNATSGALGPVIQPDGKIVICDSGTPVGGSGQDMLIARFNADGTLDSDFSFDGRVFIDFGGSDSDYCNSLALQADGRIVVVGSTSASAALDFAVARLEADGTLDTTFGSGTGKTTIGFDLGNGDGDGAQDITIQADGKLVIAGTASTTQGGVDFAVARLLIDGTLDPAFNLGGKVTIDFDHAGGASADDRAFGVAVDAQGRVLIGGTAARQTGSDFAVARLLPNGNPDMNFDADGRATVAFNLAPSGNALGMGLLLQRDGRIVLYGAADVSSNATIDYDMALARLLPDGSPDESFGFEGRTRVAFDAIPKGADLATSVVEQGNGTLVLAGYAATNVATTQALAAVARIRPDGALDFGFGTAGKKTFDIGLASPSMQLLRGVALQGTQIIVSGAAVRPDLTADDFVMRLQVDSIFADGF